MVREPQPNGLGSAQARRNYARGLAARERVLGAAMGVINAQGYNGASLQAIATSAGLTKNHILHHFATKDGLGLAVVEAALIAWRAELSIPAQIYPDALESLRFLLRRAAELQHSGWPHLRVLGVLSAERPGLEPVLRGQVEAALSEMHEFLRGLAKLLRRSGSLPPEHKARPIAGLLLGVLLGVQVLGSPDDTWGAAGALDVMSALIAPAEPTL